MVLQVADRNWDWFQHRGLSKSSHVAVANKTNTVRLRSTDDISVAFKQLHTVHCNSWIIATTSTSSPDLYRLRSRLESQLMVLPVYDPGERRRIEVSGRRFSERRRIENVAKARASNDLNWEFRLRGISEDNLKNLGIFWKSGSKNQRIKGR
ncbi:hypothetical protein LWI29_001422 [Acer saccharum]|uniref:Uncharacterized protein n=1 Tax=Acer saccharum TaxID=4024 RepID=A0AA39RXL0_ACESA|nr:hypothetical protein LWI29_001422 [Acer saccharum]